MYLKNVRAPEGCVKSVACIQTFLEPISDISERHLAKRFLYTTIFRCLNVTSV